MTIYNNLPAELVASSSDATLKTFNQYYDVALELNNIELVAMTGFFGERGFDATAAEATAITILTQAKKDNLNGMQILDSMVTLDNVSISNLVAEILNFNRYKTSFIGVVQLSSPASEVTRNIERKPPDVILGAPIVGTPTTYDYSTTALGRAQSGSLLINTISPSRVVKFSVNWHGQHSETMISIVKDAAPGTLVEIPDTGDKIVVYDNGDYTFQPAGTFLDTIVVTYTVTYGRLSITTTFTLTSTD